MAKKGGKLYKLLAKLAIGVIILDTVLALTGVGIGLVVVLAPLEIPLIVAAVLTYLLKI